MTVSEFAVDAFNQVGLRVRSADGPDRRIDLVIDLDGTTIPIMLKHRSLVTDDVARRLLKEPVPPSAVLLIVGDRVVNSARALLTSQRAGYLDLRGRLELRTDGVFIAADIEPIIGGATRTNALSGRAGLEVAAALMMHPPRPTAVRELARELDRSPSTVSSVLAALRRDGLVDDKNAVTGPELFWQLADRWPTSRVYLAKSPPHVPPEAVGEDRSVDAALRLGTVDVEHTSGWALTDSAAAAAYGAPVAFRSAQTLDFLVPDQSVVRRAQTLLGTASSPSQARATVRASPVRAAVCRRIDLATNPFSFPLTHPIFVALDLAQDIGRGREILNGWTADSWWHRAW